MNNLPGSVHVDFVAGQGPGQLSAVVSFVGEDGTVYNQGEPIALTPGNTLTYGPVGAQMTLDSNSDYQPTQQPGGPGKGGAAPTAKAGSQPHPQTPGRR